MNAVATRTARGLAAFVLLVALVAAGVGWLYLLRDAHALRAGPKLYDALPLQRLAGQGSQPLLRLVVAWLPTGIAAGVALMLLTRLGRVTRAIAAGVVTWVALFLAGGISDAVTESDPLTSHLGAQPHRAALWVAAGLVLLGALIPPSGRRRAAARPGGARVATRFAARAPWGT